ncbi:hypothetical protein [uncultured Mycolicibacterium sp.]|uniref:hypothetical protein n=1 Tax=uncultured Mycolicibacterium sp. TaxID=2320817 RepID=UPI0032B108D6
MWTPAVLVIATTTLVGCAVLGGAVYEALVVDPFWPKRPGIVQPRNGGISRARFWRPAHLAFDVLLVVSLVAGWGDPDVRAALLVAVAGHVVVRIWSAVDLTPKALAFETTDPADVNESAAARWARRSLLRLPLHVLTCAAMLSALALT